MRPQSINSRVQRVIWKETEGKRGNHVFAGQSKCISLLHLTWWNARAPGDRSDRQCLGSATLQLDRKTLLRYSSYFPQYWVCLIPWRGLTPYPPHTCNLPARQTCQRWRASGHDVIRFQLFKQVPPGPRAHLSQHSRRQQRFRRKM